MPLVTKIVDMHGMLFLTIKYVLTKNKLPCGKFYLIIFTISNILNNNV